MFQKEAFVQKGVLLIKDALKNLLYFMQQRGVLLTL